MLSLGCGQTVQTASALGLELGKQRAPDVHMLIPDINWVLNHSHPTLKCNLHVVAVAIKYSLAKSDSAMNDVHSWHCFP